jgi:hypothetical protein
MACVVRKSEEQFEEEENRALLRQSYGVIMANWRSSFCRIKESPELRKHLGIPADAHCSLYMPSFIRYMIASTTYVGLGNVLIGYPKPVLEPLGPDVSFSIFRAQRINLKSNMLVFGVMRTFMHSCHFEYLCSVMDLAQSRLSIVHLAQQNGSRRILLIHNEADVTKIADLECITWVNMHTTPILMLAASTTHIVKIDPDKTISVLFNPISFQYPEDSLNGMLINSATH